MAGLGKKTFTAGAVLTASDVNGYLMEQAVMVFGGTAARSSAIPTPSEGMVSYRTDDNAVEYYDGTAWTNVNTPFQNNQTGTTYTFVATDNGKLVTANNSSSQTFTVPPQSSVAWPAGTILSVVSYGTGSVTFAGGVGVTVTNTASTLSQYQGASLIRTGSNAWTVVPLSGGANALSDANVTGTTGSPTTGTYSSGGINYKTYSFTGTGSITTNKDGLVDVLLIGGGGGGGAYGGGGGGGAFYERQIYLTAAAHTITIGGGGAASASQNQSNYGFPTLIGSAYIAIGGGAGGNLNAPSSTTMYGASGGGGASTASSAGGAALISGQGNAGGSTSGAQNGAGGGGAGAVGGNAGGTNGGTGGNGANSSITGSPVPYAGGGGGGTNVAGGVGGTGGTGGGGRGTNNSGTVGTVGTVNTGGGGGGGGNASPSGTGYAGGSGIVIIRVRA